MKITVVTDKDGKVIGTMSHPQGPDSSHEGPTSSIRIAPESGQKAIELDLPNDALKGSAEELHKVVTGYLKKK
jgi:hypothetical protein